MMLYVCYAIQKRAFSILWLLGPSYLTQYSCLVSFKEYTLSLLALLDLTPMSKTLKNNPNTCCFSSFEPKIITLVLFKIQSTHRENYNILLLLWKSCWEHKNRLSTTKNQLRGLAYINLYLLIICIYSNVWHIIK